MSRIVYADSSFPFGEIPIVPVDMLAEPSGLVCSYTSTCFPRVTTGAVASPREYTLWNIQGYTKQVLQLDALGLILNTTGALNAATSGLKFRFCVVKCDAPYYRKDSPKAWGVPNGQILFESGASITVGQARLAMNPDTTFPGLAFEIPGGAEIPPKTRYAVYMAMEVQYPAGADGSVDTGIIPQRANGLRMNKAARVAGQIYTRPWMATNAGLWSNIDSLVWGTHLLGSKSLIDQTGYNDTDFNTGGAGATAGATPSHAATRDTGGSGQAIKDTRLIINSLMWAPWFWLPPGWRSDL